MCSSWELKLKLKVQFCTKWKKIYSIGSKFKAPLTLLGLKLDQILWVWDWDHLMTWVLKKARKLIQVGNIVTISSFNKYRLLSTAQTSRHRHEYTRCHEQLKFCTRLSTLHTALSLTIYKPGDHRTYFRWEGISVVHHRSYTLVCNRSYVT